MEQAVLPVLRDQLIVRRQKLESAATTLSDPDDVIRLLAEVDAALDRLNAGTFALCESLESTAERLSDNCGSDHANFFIERAFARSRFAEIRAWALRFAEKNLVVLFDDEAAKHSHRLEPTPLVQLSSAWIER